jgi:ubiquitin carboxyl-terminal hydrolase 8
MNTSTVKPSRSSKDPQTPPPNHSPRFQTKPMNHNSVISPPLSPSTSRDPPLPPIHAMTPTSPRNSIAHAFVPTSSFGPPSPMSSPASSPRSSQVNLSLNDVSAQFSLSSTPSSQLSKSPPPSSRDLDFAQFSQTFPSIDELEELDVLKLPSVPTTVPGAPKSKAIAGGSSSSERGGGGLVNGSGRTFPTPSVNLGPRPSSTPITPTSNTFFSRVSTPESPEIISRPGLYHCVLRSWSHRQLTCK